MSTIEKTKVPFANVPVADFVGIILDGGEQADEAMYFLLQHVLYLPLKRLYEKVQNQLFDDFDDILNDFFFHLRDGNTIGSGHNRTDDETGGNVGDAQPASDYRRPYPSLRRIRNRQAFVQWLLHTFRNYLSARADKEEATVCISLNAENVTETDVAANGSSSLLTDEQKLYLAARLIAFAHQELPPRDNFLLFRALLTMLDKRRSLPNEEVAEALGMTDVTYRVTVHRVKSRLSRYRTRLFQGEPLTLDAPHRRMAQRIREDFLQLYPTLLFYYRQSIDALDRSCSEAVKQLQQSHFAASGQLLHESVVPYEAQHSKAALWNLVGRFLYPE